MRCEQGMSLYPKRVPTEDTERAEDSPRNILRRSSSYGGHSKARQGLEFRQISHILPFVCRTTFATVVKCTPKCAPITMYRVSSNR